MLKTMQNKATMVLETLQIVKNREGEQLVYRPDREYDLLQVISDAVDQSGFDYSEYVTELAIEWQDMEFRVKTDEQKEDAKWRLILAKTVY